MVLNRFGAVRIRYEFIYCSCALLQDNTISWSTPDNVSLCHIKGTASRGIKILELASWQQMYSVIVTLILRFTLLSLL